ncbi:MAG: hypothetical protein AB8B85_16170, partial [Paracoccaceae bacterium]
MTVLLRLSIVLCFCVLTQGQDAVAQTAAGVEQTISNTGSRVLERALPTAPNQELAPLGDRTGPSPQQPLSPEQAALSVQLTNVVVQGNTVFDDDEFDGLWRELVGSEVTIGQLSNVAD